MCNDEKRRNGIQSGQWQLCNAQTTHKHEENSKWFRIYVMPIGLVWHKSKFTAGVVKRESAGVESKRASEIMRWKIQKIEKHTVSCFGFTAKVNINTQNVLSQFFLLLFVLSILLRSLAPPEWRQFFRKYFQMLLLFFIVFFYLLSVANMSAVAPAVASEKPFICNETQCHDSFTR